MDPPGDEDIITIYDSINIEAISEREGWEVDGQIKSGGYLSMIYTINGPSLYNKLLFVKIINTIITEMKELILGAYGTKFLAKLKMFDWPVGTTAQMEVENTMKMVNDCMARFYEIGVAITKDPKEITANAQNYGIAMLYGDFLITSYFYTGCESCLAKKHYKFDKTITAVYNNCRPEVSACMINSAFNMKKMSDRRTKMHLWDFERIAGALHLLIDYTFTLGVALGKNKGDISDEEINYNNVFFLWILHAYTNVYLTYSAYKKEAPNMLLDIGQRYFDAIKDDANDITGVNLNLEFATLADAMPTKELIMHVNKIRNRPIVLELAMIKKIYVKIKILKSRNDLTDGKLELISCRPGLGAEPILGHSSAVSVKGLLKQGLGSKEDVVKGPKFVCGGHCEK